MVNNISARENLIDVYSTLQERSETSRTQALLFYMPPEIATMYIQNIDEFILNTIELEELLNNIPNNSQSVRQAIICEYAYGKRENNEFAEFASLQTYAFYEKMATSVDRNQYRSLLEEQYKQHRERLHSLEIMHSERNRLPRFGIEIEMSLAMAAQDYNVYVNYYAAKRRLKELEYEGYSVEKTNLIAFITKWEETIQAIQSDYISWVNYSIYEFTSWKAVTDLEDITELRSPHFADVELLIESIKLLASLGVLRFNRIDLKDLRSRQNFYGIHFNTSPIKYNSDAREKMRFRLLHQLEEATGLAYPVVKGTKHFKETKQNPVLKKPKDNGVGRWSHQLLEGAEQRSFRAYDLHNLIEALRLHGYSFHAIYAVSSLKNIQQQRFEFITREQDSLEEAFTGLFEFVYSLKYNEYTKRLVYLWGLTEINCRLLYKSLGIKDCFILDTDSWLKLLSRQKQKIGSSVNSYMDYTQLEFTGDFTTTIKIGNKKYPNIIAASRDIQINLANAVKELLDQISTGQI
jgi:hypothetical protein